MSRAASANPSTPAIYELSIERYRGIPSLQWRPARGVNVILGGGDVGKTTILEAIALLLSPFNPANLSDPDYHDRKIDAGFSVEAIDLRHQQPARAVLAVGMDRGQNIRPQS
jgi:predicted ATP-dependent endonuclease of OLD family